MVSGCFSPSGLQDISVVSATVMKINSLEILTLGSHTKAVVRAAHRSQVTFIADVFEGLKPILSWPLGQLDVELITRLFDFL